MGLRNIRKKGDPILKLKSRKVELIWLITRMVTVYL